MNFRRIVAAVALSVCGLICLAPAAGADPAKPGNYSSTVLRITPSTDAITARVVGGDGFLELKVRPGHIVAIPGYTGEPWLRVLANGTVQENQASSATYLNQTRYGNAKNIEIPAWVTIEGATKHPQWTTVGHGGHYVWHDHRIHYMTPQIAPKLLAGTNRVIISDRSDGLWYVPLSIDGHNHQILGELLKLPAPSPLPQWGLAIVVFAALCAAGFILGDPAARIAGAALIIAGVAALVAGASELAAIPALAGGNPIWVALPAICVVLGAASLLLRSAAARSIAVLAAAAALGVWAVLRVPAFGKADPLGKLNPTLTRLIIAAALGTAAGAIVAAIASGGLALRLEGLDDGDEDDDEDDGGDGASARHDDGDRPRQDF